MPRAEGTLICSKDQVQCYRKAKVQFIEKEFFQSFKSVMNATLNNKCNCLPSCTLINYDYDISQQDFKEKVTVKNASSKLTKLSISFEDPKVTTTERSELYGVNDFMANCGGVLGLFMGVSLLSIIELVYYFTLRLACNLGCRRKSSETANAVVELPDINSNKLNQTKSLENGQFMNE